MLEGGCLCWIAEWLCLRVHLLFWLHASGTLGPGARSAKMEAGAWGLSWQVAWVGIGSHWPPGKELMGMYYLLLIGKICAE